MDEDFRVWIMVNGKQQSRDAIVVPAEDFEDARWKALDWYPQESDGGQWLTPDDLEVVSIERVSFDPAS